MRGQADNQITMLSLVTANDLVPEDHPIREIKSIVDNTLRELSPTFTQMYAETGRPSIPPGASSQSMPADCAILGAQ